MLLQPTKIGFKSSCLLDWLHASWSNVLQMQIASTWEGIRACEYLQKQGISCNMTLLFSFGQVSIVCSSCLPHAQTIAFSFAPLTFQISFMLAVWLLCFIEDVSRQKGTTTRNSPEIWYVQAAACADAGASLISPFVGRIMDWYKKKEGREFAPHEVCA